MENALTLPSENSWIVMKEQANIMLKSGFLPVSIKTPEQALTIMLKGRELNIPPMEALSGINVILGKPAVSPQLMLALARRTGQLENLEIQETEVGCMVTIKRKGQAPISTTFGENEASDLGLSGKDNYKKQAGVMYRWRALAANLRLSFPDAISGLYTIEEMSPDTIVNEEGNLIEPVKTEVLLSETTEKKKIKKPVKKIAAETKPVETVENGNTPTCCKILEITFKNTSNGGKRFKIKTDAGEFYSFSESIAEKCKEHKTEDTQCMLTVVNKGEYGNEITNAE